MNSSSLSAPLHTITQILNSFSVFEQRPIISGRRGGRPGVVSFRLRAVGPETLAAPTPPAFAPLGTGYASPAVPPPPAGPAAVPAFPRCSGSRPTRVSARFGPNEFRAETERSCTAPERREPRYPGESGTAGTPRPRAWERGRGPRERARPGPPAARERPEPARTSGAGAPSREGSSRGRAAPGLGIPACRMPTSPRGPDKLDGVRQQWGGGGIRPCGWTLPVYEDPGAGGISGRSV